MYPKELKTETQTGVCIPVVAVSLVANKWKQAKCPFLNEWKNKI